MSMSEKDFQKRTLEVAIETSLGEMGWWWISFVDEELPVGSQFLGVAVVEAENLAGAMLSTHLHGINPGGEAAYIHLPDVKIVDDDLVGDGYKIPLAYTYRLLSKAEALSAAQIR